MAVKHADAFGSIEAARRTSEQIDAERLDIDGHPTGGGNGIDKQRDLALRGDAGESLERLDRADIEVRKMNAGENRFGTDGDFERGGIDPAVGSDRNFCGTETDGLEPLDGSDHGRLFRGRIDDVASAALVGEGHAFDGEVDRFGAAAGECDV